MDFRLWFDDNPVVHEEALDLDAHPGRRIVEQLRARFLHHMDGHLIIQAQKVQEQQAIFSGQRRTRQQRAPRRVVLLVTRWMHVLLLLLLLWLLLMLLR